MSERMGMVERPVRLQLSRARGYNLQALSIATNGLAAVNVARPSKWGNPYLMRNGFTAEEAVSHFRDDCEDAMNEATRISPFAELRGKNLACWCAAGSPCHADVLLELANGFRCDAALGGKG